MMVVFATTYSRLFTKYSPNEKLILLKAKLFVLRKSKQGHAQMKQWDVCHI